MVCSGDRFITDPAELSQIKGLFLEGMAVDMEAVAIAQVCYLRHVPFLSFRFISDTPGVDGHIDQYNNFWENAPHRSFEILTQLINVL